MVAIFCADGSLKVSKGTKVAYDELFVPKIGNVFSAISARLAKSRWVVKEQDDVLHNASYIGF